MNIYGWTTCGGADVVDWHDGQDHSKPQRRRVWLWSGSTTGAGNVSVDGPLMVATDDEDMLLMVGDAIERYHRDTD